MIKVEICDRQDVMKAPRPMIRKLVRLVGEKLWQGCVVSVALVDEDEMTALNQRYTGRRGDADVLAFPLQDGAPGDDTVGEIVVCASRACKEALARGIEPQEELMLYVVHGAAHLAGFDDLTTLGRRHMYAREEDILRRAGVRNARHCARLKSRVRRKRVARVGRRGSRDENEKDKNE
jgi:probable rRNA maturation factor